MFAKPEIVVDRRSDGTVLLRSSWPLGDFAPSVGSWLDEWAEKAPDRIFLAERTSGAGGTWRTATYGETRARVRRLASGLLARKLGAETPVVILSGNGLDHALVSLACQYVGVPVAPLSTAYSLASRDFGKLRSIFELLRPRLVFVLGEDAEAFGPALRALDGFDFDVAPFVEMLVEDPSSTSDVDERAARVGPDTIAKILFTSGSTGEPKGVVNTHRMLTSNQKAYAEVWPFLDDEAPVLVDWLPWSHTFGGNSNFNLVLSHGGTFYLDHGRPLPGRLDPTLESLREVAPTVYFNVPRGYEVLLPHLERDAALRARFFSRLRFLFYAAAALPHPVWERLERMSISERGERVPMISAWGSTETAPMATVVHFPIERAGVIGLPGPGCELKLAPVEGKLEARVRGPNVTPGYWKRPDATAAAFDEEGFYRSGDAVRFVDPSRPEKGLAFDGRLSENFKLTSGTWVRVGALRLRALAALAPVAQDVVVAGADRDEVRLLVFPDVAACRALATDLGPEAALDEVLAHPEVRSRLRAGLGALRAEGGGSSTFATRALFLEEPPSIDAGEITDKGYVNQRAVLANRAARVEALYGPAGSEPLLVEIDGSRRYQRRT
jgi:feruloyl-CoA synthase